MIPLEAFAALRPGITPWEAARLHRGYTHPQEPGLGDKTAPAFTAEDIAGWRADDAKPYDEAELRERFTPVPQDGASAGRILDLAKTAVTTDRSKTHGAKERSFELIAEFWGTYLEGRGDDPLSGRDVAIMMVLLKIARATQGTPVEDHFVDMAGYSAVAGELA